MFTCRTTVLFGTIERCKSIGSRRSLPNINWAGVQPVISCIEDLYVISRRGTCTSQSHWFASTNLDIWYSMVRLNLSTIPSDSGYRGVVLVFVIPKSWHISAKTADSKFWPWSEWMICGVPKRHTNSFTRTSATVVASWFGRGYWGCNVTTKCSFPAQILLQYTHTHC